MSTSVRTNNFRFSKVSTQCLAVIAGLMSVPQPSLAAPSVVRPPVVRAPSELTSPVTLPVIVVFREGGNFEPFRGRYRADERARANAPAWDYLDTGVAGAVQRLEGQHRFRSRHVFSAVKRGFAAELSAQQIETLKNDPLVEYVEPDGKVTISAQAMPWGINRIDADVSSTRAGNGAGAINNVRAYIIDTGIASHTDLRVVQHVNFTGDGKNYDCNGHGTHVAGTIAAKDNTGHVVGAIPGAPLVDVKVLGCDGSGTFSSVLKGVDWVTANAVKPAIANMSLTGGVSQTIDDAVIRSVDRGVFYSIAAGNNGADACLSSPARIGATKAGVMTVAATDKLDQEASWSNYGSCVDIWAPGVDIVSTRMGGGTVIYSGTSMAAPHVAGTAGLYLSSRATLGPAQVESALKTIAPLTGTVSKDGRLIRMDYAGGF